MATILKRFARDESGATAIEYGLLAILVAVALITAASTLNDSISRTVQNVATSVSK
ncbi:MAG: Flp family type IVb pilin [Methylobacterium frigidaeris]